MRFYDLNVRADSPENLEETLRIARELGWSGLGLVIPYNRNFSKNLETLRKEVRNMNPKPDIAFGVEIPGGSPGKIRKTARDLRKKVELVLVSGGDLEANRKALETPEVDMLSHPCLGRNDPGLDHVMAKLARENQVSVEFSFNEMLYAYKKRRSQVLQNLLGTAKLARKYRAPFTLSSGAKGPWDLRSPSELIALGRVLGLGSPPIRQSLSGEILQENRKRLGREWVMPGVEVEP